MKAVKAVGIILIDKGNVLAEKRKATKKRFPGKLTLPAGHIEEGETPEEAARRELEEELGLTAEKCVPVTTLEHVYGEELIRIHFYKITRWSGEMKKNEAEELRWVPLGDLSEFCLETDLEALRTSLTSKE